jgi:hypothetical protein
MDEIIEDAHVAGKGYSHHRVGQVSVKSRKEPEAVFARKIRAATNACTRNGQAASLPAEDSFRLVNGNLKSALDQFVRGTQARNASTQYRHSNGHVDYVTTATRTAIDQYQNARGFRSTPSCGNGRRDKAFANVQDWTGWQ